MSFVGPEKRHIGDGAFVEFDGYHIVLTTSDGIRDTNRVCLDPGVVAMFDLWMKEHRAAVAAFNDAAAQGEKG